MIAAPVRLVQLRNREVRGAGADGEEAGSFMVWGRAQGQDSQVRSRPGENAGVARRNRRRFNVRHFDDFGLMNGRTKKSPIGPAQSSGLIYSDRQLALVLRMGETSLRGKWILPNSNGGGKIPKAK